MNMYLQRHLTYLKVSEEIFTVRKVVDYISKYYKIFGYKGISVQNSIRELETSRLISTEKRGRDKFFLRLPEQEFKQFQREGSLEALNRLLERVSDFFIALDGQQQQTFRQLLRTTKFWEILHGDVTVDYQQFHRSQTLQNLQILEFIANNQISDIPVLKDLIELSNNYRKIIQPIVLRNPLIANQESEIPVLSTEQLSESPTFAKILNTPMKYDMREIKDQILKMKNDGRFLEAINLLSHPKIFEIPTLIVQQADVYYYLSDITKFKSKLEDLIDKELNYTNKFTPEDQNIIHSLYLEYLLISRKIEEIDPFLRAVEAKPNFIDLHEFPETWSRFLTTKAKWELELGKFEPATQLASEAFENSKKFGFNLEAVRALSMLGVINSRSTNYDQALSYYNQAKLLASEFKLIYELSIIHVRLGNLCWRSGDYEEAITFANLARKTLERIGSKEYLAKVYSNMGLAYRRLGKTEEARFFVNRGIEIAKKIGLEEVYYIGLANLITLYADMLMLQEGQRIVDSLEYDERFQELIKIDGRFQTLFYDKYAHIAIRMGNFKEALKYHQLRKEIAITFNDKKRMIKIQIDIGETHRLRGDIYSAKKIFDDIDIEEVKNVNIQYYIVLLMSIAHINSSLKKSQQAIDIIEECYSLVQSIGNSSQMMEVLSVWFMLEMISGNDPKSQEIFLEMNKLRQLEDSESVELQYLRTIISILEKQQYPRAVEEILTETAYQKISLMSKVAFEYSSVLKLQRLKLLSNKYYSQRSVDIHQSASSLLLELREHAIANSNERLKVELQVIEAYMTAIDSKSDDFSSILTEASNRSQVLGLLRLHDETIVKQERFKNLQKRGQSAELAISLESDEFESSGISQFLEKELDKFDYLIDQNTLSL